MFPPHSFSWFFLLGDDVKSERILYIVALTKQTSLCVVLRSISPEREREKNLSLDLRVPEDHGVTRNPPPPTEGLQRPFGPNTMYTCMYMAGWLDVLDPPPPHCAPKVSEMHYSIWSDVETRNKGGGLRTTVAPALLLFSFVLLFFSTHPFLFFKTRNRRISVPICGF